MTYDACLTDSRQGSAYMLVSGGDDNAVIIHTFQIEDDSSFHRLSHGSCLSAHAAQITGLTCYLFLLFN